MNSPLVIAGRTFRSRLILGTGKFSSPEAMRDALAASGAELVTVALRRADLSGQRDPFANILEFIDPKKYLLLPDPIETFKAAEILVKEGFTVLPWVVNFQKVRSLRKYKLIRAVDQAVVSQAETYRVFVNVTTGQPITISDEVKNTLPIVGMEMEP